MAVGSLRSVSEQRVDRVHVDHLQLRTTKANQLSISGTRFFGKNLTADLKPDGQKELKNGVFMLFPRILAAPNF